MIANNLLKQCLNRFRLIDRPKRRTLAPKAISTSGLPSRTSRNSGMASRGVARSASPESDVVGVGFKCFQESVPYRLALSGIHREGMDVEGFGVRRPQGAQDPVCGIRAAVVDEQKPDAMRPPDESLKRLNRKTACFVVARHDDDRFRHAI